MRSILIILFILCLGNLLALMNAPQQITGIPSGDRFAGYDAAAYHNGNMYFVYLKNQPDHKLRDLIFVKSPDDGQSYSSQTITTVHDYGICGSDSLGHFTTNDKSAPTIFVNDEHIIITYHDFGKFYTAISSDNGTSFTINQFDEGYDPLPFVQESNGQLHSYVSIMDPATDMLYSAFYNRFETENADLGGEAGRTYFWGPDVVYGPVRSNTDIWVEQAGGGTNNGWPTFWGPVYTSGVIQSSTGTVPYSTIFRGPVYEHVAPTKLGGIIGVYAGPHFPGGHNQNYIDLVRVNGSVFTSWVGIKTPHINPYNIDVYALYPPPQGPVLATNTITSMDTIWVQGPSGSVVNNSIYCQNELWIEGTFSGRQVWGCADTIRIIGNIKLTETPLGTNADGGNNPGTANLHDYVALISEQKIMIAYGYKDPADSLRKHTTCGGDNSGVWIYASLFAFGDGDGNPHRDGVFTFDYQHPHHSTPDQIIDGQNYDLNDLHSHIFPQTPESPWPGALDYPWYNPLWPEANPYLERGSVHLYGSVYQRRAGFLHRSVSDPPNHDGTWNFANYKYGSACTGINYPGASGSGIGYKKDFHYDTRLKDGIFNFYVNANFINLMVSSDMQSWEYRALIPSERVISKTMQIENDQEFLTLNNQVYVNRSGHQVLLPVQPQIQGHIQRSFSNNSDAYLLTSIDTNTSDSDTLQIIHLNMGN
ncbi:MAG TPA: hypothetical protein PKK33_09670, partial [Candidatus Cloacimonadota bacterium]|nr:hypothetical protein [Candidatus Cloacimonadota bacterium]